MDKTKKRRLEAKGWRIGNVREFLALSPEESEYVELKLTLSKDLQKRRRSLKLTQHQMARLLKSSQSRIAKMEAGDPSVSIDLLVRSLLTLRSPRKALTRTLSL